MSTNQLIEPDGAMSNVLPARAPGDVLARQLSGDLNRLVEHASGKPITLGAVIDFLGERGHALFMIVLAFPFLLPVPTMGLSAPAGFAIAVMGLCVMVGRRPFLPGYLASREIQYVTLKGVVAGIAQKAESLERLLKPRAPFMFWPGLHVILGLAIAFAGFVLGLPIPLPFANAIPAVAVIFFAGGMLERDGAFVLAGHGICASLIVLAVVLWETIRVALEKSLSFVFA
jgi:hypothetical protein